MSEMRSRYWLVFAALFLSGAVVVARGRMPPLVDEKAAERALRALPSPDVARAMSLGYTTLAADYRWLQALQYFGNAWNQPLHYRDLYSFIDLLSELDPRWPMPLLFGGIALPQNLGRETWINMGESTRLFERGIERFPDMWEFYVFGAYNLMQYHHEPERAAQYLMACSKVPNCPSYAPRLATRILAASGRAETALEFAEELLASSPEPALAEALKERIVVLRIERDLERLDQALTRFRAEHGRLPGALSEVVSKGFIDAIPAEPRGGTYYFDFVSGKALSTTHQKRLKVYGPRKYH